MLCPEQPHLCALLTSTFSPFLSPSQLHPGQSLDKSANPESRRRRQCLPVGTTERQALLKPAFPFQIECCCLQRHPWIEQVLSTHISCKPACPEGLGNLQGGRGVQGAVVLCTLASLLHFLFFFLARENSCPRMRFCNESARYQIVGEIDFLRGVLTPWLQLKA